MKYLAVILLLGVYIRLYAQKPPLTIESFKEYPEMIRWNISNDGRHAWFITMDKPKGWVLHITSADTTWKKGIATGHQPAFTPDSKYFLYKIPVDTLFIEDLDKRTATFITDVSDFTISGNGSESWIAYKTYKDNSLIVRNIGTGVERNYKSAVSCTFNPQGTAAIIHTPDAVLWLSLATLKEKLIAQDSSIRNTCFSPGGDRVVWMSGGNQLTYYMEGTDSVNKVQLDNISTSPPYFNPDGNTIFYSRHLKVPTITRDKSVITNRVNIWHYKDEYLQEYQLENQQEQTYLTAFATGSKRVIPLEGTDTSIVLLSDHYALVRRNVNMPEANLKREPLPGLVLISLLSGQRREIKSRGNMLEDISISPGERFIIWFDAGIKHYFSYEVSTGILRNISKHIPYPVFDKESEKLSSQGPYGIVGWLNGSGLLIYDRFDIWLVDPSNKQLPVNISNGYGRKNNMVLRNATTTLTDTLLLAGFNIKDKRNGYFWLNIGKVSEPVPIVFGHYLYYFPPLEIIFSDRRPVKAKGSKAFLTQRMSAASYPNLFLVNEQNQEIPLTTYQPHQQYNWLTAELIHWKLPDGKRADGILYKPEDFDPLKKYPVIFNYYEKKSNGLHIYRKPELSNGSLDIPWYVSNGYLVVLPDIYFKPGLTGESALQSVVTAAAYLSAFPWVNKDKMGLQGHSFGGFETNYIISHSRLFAAAQEGAGSCNLVSAYGHVSRGGGTRHEIYETGQGNMRTTPWKHPDVYIKNSPIFKVHKVTTPLLMMHNKDDSAVPFGQAMELFTALRRENKKVWLLQYDGGSHTLDGDPDMALDFTIRQRQFFDHYLKDSLPPLWMTEGVPAVYKGLKPGLEKDSSGKKP